MVVTAMSQSVAALETNYHEENQEPEPNKSCHIRQRCRAGAGAIVRGAERQPSGYWILIDSKKNAVFASSGPIKNKNNKPRITKMKTNPVRSYRLVAVSALLPLAPAALAAETPATNTPAGWQKPAW